MCPIQVEATTQFKKAPVGTYQAVCCEVVDLGYSTKVYKNQSTGLDESKNVHEIQYIFQLNKLDDETGKRFDVRSRPLNLILSEQSNLRAFLLAWRGHDLTEAELKPPGVDVDLSGKNALISVVHNQSAGKTYANIGSITPLMDGMAEIQPLNYEPQAEAILAAKAKAAAGGTGQAAPAAQPATNGQVQTAQAAPQTAASGQSQSVAQPAGVPTNVTIPGPGVPQNIPGHPEGCQCDKCHIPF